MAQLRLTDQEKRIVDLLVQGCTNEEIAAKLGMPVDAVMRCRSRVYDKLGVCTQLELAQYVLRHPLDRGTDEAN